MSTSNYIKELARQIDGTSECEALEMIMDQHMDSVRDLLKEKGLLSKDIISKFLPLMKFPSNPWKAVKWVKKFIANQISPQLEAQITIIQEMIEVASALRTVSSAVGSAGPRLQRCRVNFSMSEFQTGLNNSIRDLDNQISNGLGDIEQAQNDLEGVLGKSLSKRIDTSSQEGFSSSAGGAMEDIKKQVDEFNDEDLGTEEPETYSGTVDVSTSRFTIEEGAIASIEPLEQGETFSGILEAGTNKMTIENGIITKVENLGT